MEQRGHAVGLTARKWEGVAVRTPRRGSSEDMEGCSSEDMQEG